MSMNLPISFHIAVACSFLPKCSTSSLECAAIKKNQFHFWWTFRWFPVWGYYCFRFSWDHSHSFPGVHVTGISPAAFREESVCVPPTPPRPIRVASSVICQVFMPVWDRSFLDPVICSLVSAMPVRYFIIPKRTKRTRAVICRGSESVHHLDTGTDVFGAVSLSIYLDSLSSFDKIS